MYCAFHKKTHCAFIVKYNLFYTTQNIYMTFFKTSGWRSSETSLTTWAQFKVMFWRTFNHIYDSDKNLALWNIRAKQFRDSGGNLFQKNEMHKDAKITR